MALLSKFQDGQALVIDGLAVGEKPQTKAVAQALRAIRRPDLSEAEATESVGETKSKALSRTLDRRTVLLGLPAHDPVLYRKTLPEDMKKKIREAFYSVKNLPFGEMGTVARFDPITDQDYDPLRDIAKTLNLDLTKVK